MSVKLAIEANNLVVRLCRLRRTGGGDYERLGRLIEKANKRAAKRHKAVLKSL